MRRAQTATTRPMDCPEELGIHEKYQWTLLMKRAPAGHFLPIDIPAIVLYCQLTTLHAKLYPSIHAGTATRSEREEFLSLSAQIRSLHRGLRIGPSTRNGQREKASRNARDAGDAFNPGGDWRESFHGAGKA